MMNEQKAPASVGQVEQPVRPLLPKWVLYDKSETLFESVATDCATFGGLVFCTWFSQKMGSGVWEAISVAMFISWLFARLPWERATRTTTMRTKADAIAWANALPDDERPNVADKRRLEAERRKASD
jgi:hypothetical protein